MKQNIQPLKIYREGKLDKWATYKQQVGPITRQALHRLKEIGENTRELIAENRVNV